GLPEDDVAGAVSALRSADMLIIGGTSLTVYPAASFINHFKGNRLVVINRDPLNIRMSGEVLTIQEKIGEVFAKLAKLQGIEL
ncbi:MAG: NAD-dependent protein deacylase, partial [Lachnospiraceae bacterium]|nr:NAD-dependent protein deacylase [Lachnospiraceae bacterium]